MTGTDTTATTGEESADPYGWYAVGVLIVAYTFSFIDRQALTLMVDPIRKSLSLSDTEISLLHGLAFAVFYSVMGIPIGRMVDSRRRTTIIAAGIAVWSVMTALCGLARNFVEMFLARIGVGVGEAALTPGAYSLISDWFPARKRTLALSMYLGAAYIGAGLATMIGGTLIAAMPAVSWPVVGHLEPWQAIFVVIGLPGLLVALWAVTMREPPRRDVKAGIVPAFREVRRHIGEHRAAFGLVIGGFAFSGLMWNGSVAWWPTYFMRNFGWTASDVGFRYGLVLIVTGVGGALSGGMIATMLRQRGHVDANVRIGLVSLALAVPAGLFAALIGTAWATLGGVAVFLFACSMPWGGAAASLQELSPNQMRGQISAIYILVLNLVGLGAGPLIVAQIKELVFGSDLALGSALAVTITGSGLISAVILVFACGAYRKALVRVAA